MATASTVYNPPELAGGAVTNLSTTEVPFGNAAGTGLESSADLVFNDTTNTLEIDNVAADCTFFANSRWSAGTSKFRAEGNSGATEIGQFSASKTGNLFGRARADAGFVVSAPGSFLGVGTVTAFPVVFGTNDTERAHISALGSVVIGTAALATTATDGFLYIPTCAGTPTGVPTAFTGRVAMVFDTTNNEFYIYDGGWLSGAAFT